MTAGPLLITLSPTTPTRALRWLLRFCRSLTRRTGAKGEVLVVALSTLRARSKLYRRAFAVVLLEVAFQLFLRGTLLGSHLLAHVFLFVATLLILRRAE